MPRPANEGGPRPLPKCVLVHGYSCTREHWSGTLQRLGGVADVLAVSLPGHDDVPLPQAELDMAACSAHVEEAIEGVGWREACLVGHSLGGMVGMICAHQRPELVGGLVLVDAFPRLGPPPPFHMSFWAGSPSSLKGETVRGMIETRRRLPPALWESVVAFDGGQLLASLQVPVRGIYGDRGEVDHATLANALRTTGLQRALDLDLSFISRAGHFVMLEQPDSFCEALIGVVRDLAGG